MILVLDEVLRKVSAATGVEIQDILGQSRQKKIAQARIAVYRELRAMGYSFPEIGAAMSRDHTTVLRTLQNSGKKSETSFFN